MKHLHFPLLFLFFGIFSPVILGQSAPKADDPPTTTASVAGRVTLDGQPVAGAKVIVLTESSEKPIGKVTTDAAGRFRIGGLPGGTLYLRVGYGAAVNENEEDYSGKPVTLDSGEALDDIEFKLRPGGVITGRVTDAENRPMAGQDVKILRIQKNPKTGEERVAPPNFDISGKFQTDDRGIYRAYGLPPGRYVVGVGDIKIDGQTQYDFGDADRIPPAFHPKAADWKQATVIEVAAGTVEDKRDITAGGKDAVFTISGRLVDDETNAPVAKMAVGVRVKGAPGASFNGGSDTRGEFRLTAMKPGEYQVMVQSWSKENEYYADPLPVEVRNADLKDVTIRLKRGVAVSGRIELATGPVQFDQYFIGLRPATQSGDIPYGRSATPEPDGTFRIPGVRPGNFTFTLYNANEELSPLRITAVRRGDADLPAGEIEIGAETVGDIRVLARVGSGKLRGEVRFVGGEPPAGNRYAIILKPVESMADNGSYAELDDRRRFSLNGLLPGTYTLRVRVKVGTERWTDVKTFTPNTVTIPETGEAPLTLTVDLSTPNEPKPE